MNTYKDLEEFIIKSDGIIYGGYVRDKMINNYYGTELIKPTDIDVYFKTEEEATKLIRELYKYGNITKTRTNKLDYAGIGLLLQFKTIYYRSDNDNSFILDISFPLNEMRDLCHQLEPPFLHLDFTCNGFLLDKQGIHYSTTTGTYIDNLSDKRRLIEIREITYDMYGFMTTIIRENKVKYQEIYMKMRIIKMINKEVSWKISNLNLKMLKSIGNRCDCCDEKIKKQIIKINNKNYSIDCFLSL